MSEGAVTVGAHGPAHGKKGLGNPVLGMLLFIVSEIMFFGGLFAAYFNLRTSAPAWPPTGNGAFLLHEEVVFPAVMTAILILSSVTCQMAVWRIRRGAIWPQTHNDVLQKLLRKVRKGDRIIFIPGNHDEGLRQYCGQHFGGIEIEHQAMRIFHRKMAVANFFT